MRGVLLGCWVALALLWTGTAAAATITVDCDHADLQTKIDNAAPGSTLKISHLVVKGGFSTSIGGGTGIVHTSADLTLRHMTFRGNRINTPGNGARARPQGKRCDIGAFEVRR